MKDLYNDIVRIDNRINELEDNLNDPLQIGLVDWFKVKSSLKDINK